MFPATSIEMGDIGVGQAVDGTCAVRGAVNGIVVEQYDGTVLCRMDIKFNLVHAEFKRRANSGERVLRLQARRAAMAANLQLADCPVSGSIADAFHDRRSRDLRIARDERDASLRIFHNRPLLGIDPAVQVLHALHIDVGLQLAQYVR